MNQQPPLCNIFSWKIGLANEKLYMYFIYLLLDLPPFWKTIQKKK